MPRHSPRLHDDDLRPDIDASVEVDHVFVAHADATGRYRAADRPWGIGAVDAVERRPEIEGARAERVCRTAFHAGRQIVPLGGLASDHFLRRHPARPLRLAGDGMRAGPFEAGLADADAVTARLAAARHQVEEAVIGIDDDGAGGMLRLIGHRLRQELRVELAADNAVGPYRHGLDVALPDGVPARLAGALVNCRRNRLSAGRVRFCG